MSVLHHTNVATTDYLSHNLKHWSKGYDASNVESYIFRFAGRVLKPEFNLPQNNEQLLDLGCGQGANVEFFNKIGFNAHGCDISDTDINVAKIRYPHISDKFSVCNTNPADNPYYGWPNNISVAVGAQSFLLLQQRALQYIN